MLVGRVLMCGPAWISEAYYTRIGGLTTPKANPKITARGDKSC